MKKIMAFGLAVACLTAQAQEIRWPSANSGWLKGGRYVNSENLSKMQAGLNREQVRDLIGFPSYNEGIKVMDWTYLMNFLVNGETVQCQYKVLFDNRYKVNAMMWKPVGDHSCPPVEAKPEPPPLVVMSADGLFKFDSTELLPQGVAEIRDWATKADRNKTYQVTAYADRLGNPQYNKRLSQARADMVVRALSSVGIQSQGRGAGSISTTNCVGRQASAALIACLQPDRKVEIR
ncbi:Outer membrane protein A [Ephemeroptericola cinctiostellae]|uniref:Outer membrane protein A n=1 Tax=Ephemeroptericola cinctiostellae TaxID=2268024 RepID=A0A345D9E8_9BURK|nr:outer membrane protein assembly factor BamE [Ephemeroptericola cinctiostellae]AXF84986.1 Outer membrane protein A [Ephemeroptericola cinctiostellae]